MSGHRHAAVALHALASADQEQILAALPRADQAILRGYIDELDALGFDPEQSARALAPSAARVAADPQAGAVHQIRHANATTMSHVLSGEPARLVAQVLALENWPWAGGLLANLDPLFHTLVRAAQADAAPIGSARRACLLGALAQRVAQYQAAHPATDVDAAPTGWLAKVTAWIR